MVTRQPTPLNTLYSSLTNSYCLAALPGEVDCLGVLSTLRRMDPGQRSLHVLEMGSGAISAGNSRVLGS